MVLVALCIIYRWIDEAWRVMMGEAQPPSYDQVVTSSYPSAPQNLQQQEFEGSSQPLLSHPRPHSPTVSHPQLSPQQQKGAEAIGSNNETHSLDPGAYQQQQTGGYYPPPPGPSYPKAPYPPPGGSPHHHADPAYPPASTYPPSTDTPGPYPPPMPSAPYPPPSDIAYPPDPAYPPPQPLPCPTQELDPEGGVPVEDPHEDSDDDVPHKSDYLLESYTDQEAGPESKVSFCTPVCFFYFFIYWLRERPVDHTGGGRY